MAILTQAFLYSCKNTHDAAGQEAPEMAKPVVIQLADSLGSIAIALPARYNNYFSWTDYSDCGKPCNKIKYRYQPQSLPEIKESGFYFKKVAADSVERFTVVHSGYIQLHPGMDSAYISLYKKYSRLNAEADPALGAVLADTIEKIDNHYISELIIERYDTARKQYTARLLAATGIEGNMVQLNFELLTRDTTAFKNRFIDRARYWLRTARFSKGM